MHHRYLLRRIQPILVSILMAVLVFGCGSDNPTGSPTNPLVTMSLTNDSGLPVLTVRNAGETMTTQSLFIATFGDDTVDTVGLQLTAHDSITCTLSNIRGPVEVTNDDYGLHASIGDCLSNYFENVVSSIDFNSFVPSPLTQGTYLTCTYSVYLTDLAATSVSFDMNRTDSGLTLTAIYHDITGHLTGTSPGIFCPDFTGGVTMTSIVVDLNINIGEGPDPTITVGGSQASINGLQINIDGALGALVESITDGMISDFVTATEAGIENYLASSLGSDLSGLVIVKSTCAL